MVCLFCKQSKDPSVEHVFSERLGHVGVVRDVCRDCNSVLGQQVDIAADRDAILSTARRQAGLPILAQSIREVDALIETAGHRRLRLCFDIAADQSGSEVTPLRSDRGGTARLRHGTRDRPHRADAGAAGKLFPLGTVRRLIRGLQRNVVVRSDLPDRILSTAGLQTNDSGPRTDSRRRRVLIQLTVLGDSNH